MTATVTPKQQPTRTSTRTAREQWLRLRPWLVTAVFALAALAVTISISVSAANQTGYLLSPTSAKPNGAKALAQTLDSHGVDVETVDRFEDAREAVTSNPNQTLVVHDPGGFLTVDRVRELLNSGASRVVFLNPVGTRFSPLNAIASYGGALEPTEDSKPHHAGDQCPLADLAPKLSDGRATAFRATAVNAASCYTTDAGELVLMATHGGSEVVMIGAYSQLTNERIAEEANAAAAINLLGKYDHLTWYVPGPDDVPPSDKPTFGDYVPGWLTPTILLLGCVAVATMFWRGNRLGPLVAERLPVHVPANETVTGRGKLYAATSSRLHALDAIRLGTLRRCAAMLGMSASSSADAIMMAIASNTGSPVPQVRAVLRDVVPESDAAMVELANEAAAIEQRVRAVVGHIEPTRATSSAPPDDHPETYVDPASQPNTPPTGASQ